MIKLEEDINGIRKCVNYWQRLRKSRPPQRVSLRQTTLKKAQGCMTEIADLQAQYEIAEKLFKAEQSKVPDGNHRGKERHRRRKPTLRLLLAMLDDGWQTCSAEHHDGQQRRNHPRPPLQTASSIRSRKFARYSLVTMFHVKGTLKIPVYGDKADSEETAHNINVAFSDEFSELTADVARLRSVDLRREGISGRGAGADWQAVVKAMPISTLLTFIVNEMAPQNRMVP